MKRKRSAVEQHFCTLQNRRHFGKWFKNKENCTELHHGKERKECERMECKSGISCEKAFLDRERSVDAFCVKMKFSCAVGKKSGRNVIKEKFVVCSSIAFLFVFFPLSSFFPSWNFLWGELPHCTKLLFLHAFTLHIRREATDWRPHLPERKESPTFSFKFSKWHYRWIFRWVSTDTAASVLAKKKPQLLWSVLCWY